MALPQSAYKDRQLLAVIGDEDSVTGLLLAGIGVRHSPSLPSAPFKEILTNLPSQHVTPAPDAQRNFLVVDNKTETAEISRAFENYTRERKDIGILFINQHVRMGRAARGRTWRRD